MSPRRVYTIGHSTRPAADLIALLREHGVTLLVDVRRYPGSRRHPQFGAAALQRALTPEGIAYRHEPDLGGRRDPAPDSRNTAWRNAAFRGYADHMASPGFRAALGRVLEASGRDSVAIMCAEAAPGQCHRQLVADALVTRGAQVLHIVGPGSAEPHRLNPAARALPDGTLVYAKV